MEPSKTVEIVKEKAIKTILEGLFFKLLQQEYGKDFLPVVDKYTEVALASINSMPDSILTKAQKKQVGEKVRNEMISYTSVDYI